jgi:nucleoside-diphosphate-sugar epimerase
MTELKSILVTGGCGYVGTKLVPELLESDYSVHVMDWMIYGNHLPFSRKLSCYNIDLRNFGAVRDIVERIQPDAVIDLASISNDPMGDLEPSLTKAVNIEAQKNLIDLCLKNNVKRFIFASSSSVYGVNDDPNITEETPLAPVSLYSETKAVIESYLKGKTSDDFVTVSIRPATVCGYSPRQRLDLIVNLLTFKGYYDGKIVIEGGERVRPHIHIDDMVDVYLAVLAADSEIITGKTYNCGAETMSLMELGKLVQGFVNCEIKTAVGPDKRSHSLNSGLIRKELGFSFSRTVKMAIDDLIFAFENCLIDKNNPELFNLAWYKQQIKNGKIVL